MCNRFHSTYLYTRLCRITEQILWRETELFLPLPTLYRCLFVHPIFITTYSLAHQHYNPPYHHQRSPTRMHLPNRLHKLLEITQQHLRLLHSSKMPTLIMTSTPRQITSRLDPADRYWSKFIRKPTVAKRLSDVVLGVNVWTGDLWIVFGMTWCGTPVELGVGVDGAWEGLG